MATGPLAVRHVGVAAATGSQAWSSNGRGRAPTERLVAAQTSDANLVSAADATAATGSSMRRVRAVNDRRAALGLTRWPKLAGAARVYADDGGAVRGAWEVSLGEEGRGLPRRAMAMSLRNRCILQAAVANREPTGAPRRYAARGLPAA